MWQLDPISAIVLGFSLWLVVLPNQAARFYRWFYGRAGVDQRRLDAISARGLRVGGIVMLGVIAIVFMLTAR